MLRTACRDSCRGLAERWQDVEQLLEAGIDVISTVNVQHLESLNDVVEAITGVHQRETVPDSVVRAAEQRCSACLRTCLWTRSRTGSTCAASPVAACRSGRGPGKATGGACTSTRSTGRSCRTGCRAGSSAPPRGQGRPATHPRPDSQQDHRAASGPLKIRGGGSRLRVRVRATGLRNVRRKLLPPRRCRSDRRYRSAPIAAQPSGVALGLPALARRR